MRWVLDTETGNSIIQNLASYDPSFPRITHGKEGESDEILTPESFSATTTKSDITITKRSEQFEIAFTNVRYEIKGEIKERI